MTISRKAHRIVIFGLLALVLAVATACANNTDQDSLIERLDAINRPFEVGDTSSVAAPSSEPIQLTLRSIGDILFHHPWQQEYDPYGNPLYPTYFQYINDLTIDADLAFCNVEAPLAGGELSGYPTFNMGDSMATAVQEAGFDVVYTAHNHMLDQQGSAVFRTLEVLRAAGLATTGSRLSTDEPNFALVESHGLKIAVIAYTYESSPGMINGIPIPSDIDPYINSFTGSSEADLNDMKAAIDASRAAGADLVIFYMHAGTEYSHEPDYEQRTVAQFVIDNGVDIIFGSHVHVLQPMEILYPSSGGTPVPVYWGMGNYISSQIVEGGMEPANEEGIMAELSLTWNPATRQIDAFTMDYLPLWTLYHDRGDYLVYTTIPERGDVSENPSIQASGKLQRALNAFAEIRAFLAEPLSWQRG